MTFIVYPSAELQRQSEIDKTADLIKSRFGTDAILRGSVLEHGTEHRPMPRTTDETA